MSIVQPLLVLQEEIGSGQIPDEPDINLNPVFDKLEPSNVDLEDVATLSFAFNRRDEETNFDANPLFTVVDHELETPDGVEGPHLTYLKPDSVSFNTDPRLKNMSNQTRQIQEIEEDMSMHSQIPCM